MSGAKGLGVPCLMRCDAAKWALKSLLFLAAARPIIPRLVVIFCTLCAPHHALFLCKLSVWLSRAASAALVPRCACQHLHLAAFG